MTNKEIAEAMHLSVRTVETHLAKAYRKLGLRSRTEFAAHLIDTGRTKHQEPNRAPP